MVIWSALPKGMRQCLLPKHIIVNAASELDLAFHEQAECPVGGDGVTGEER